MYSITARRMISGLVLKYLKEEGLVIPKRYATALPRSSKVLLTRPLETELGLQKYLVFGGNQRLGSINDWLLERIDPDQIGMTCQDIKSMETAVQMGTGIGTLPTRF